MNNDYVPISGAVLAKTPKAVLLCLDEDADELWVPRSVIFEDDLDLLVVGELVEINVAQWFHEREIA